MSKLILLYLFLKIISITLLILVLPDAFSSDRTTLSRDYFWYPDLTEHDYYYGSCSSSSPNFLYTLFICWSGIESLSGYPTIIISFLLSTFRDIAIIWIAINKIKSNYFLLIGLVILLGIHPYLSYQHIRLTTDLFASLGLLLLFFYAYYDKRVNLFFILTSCLLVGFRNSLVFPFLVFLLFNILFIKLSYKEKILYSINSIGLLGIILGFGAKTYSSLFLPGLHYGPYSFFAFKEYFEFLWQPISIFISFLSVLISHTFFLLSTREYIIGYGFETILETNFIGQVVSIAFIFIMLIVNAAGVYGTLKYFYSRNKMVITIFSYVVPSFLIVAHIRYLYPLIPLLMLGLVLWLDIALKKSHNNI